MATDPGQLHTESDSDLGFVKGDRWQAMRIGVAAETMLTDHFIGNTGELSEVFPASGRGSGVNIEILLSHSSHFAVEHRYRWTIRGHVDGPERIAHLHFRVQSDTTQPHTPVRRLNSSGGDPQLSRNRLMAAFTVFEANSNG